MDDSSPYENKHKNFSHIVHHCPGAKLAESSGVTHSGKQEGESQPFRGWKGKGIHHLRTWKGSRASRLDPPPGRRRGRKRTPEVESKPTL